MSSSAYMVPSVARLGESADGATPDTAGGKTPERGGAPDGDMAAESAVEIRTGEAAVPGARAAQVQTALSRAHAETLAALATTGGLANGHLRAAAWPLLMARTHRAGRPAGAADFLVVNDLPPHKDEPQVMLDVKRSFTVVSQFPAFHPDEHSSFTTILSQDDIDTMRKRLYSLVVRVLRTYPCLNYYQGYHDVASVVLLVCTEANMGDDHSFAILEALTLQHLRDFMLADIALSVNHLKLVPLILEHADPQLFSLLVETSNAYNATAGAYYDYKFLPPLSSVLTLFSHDIPNMHQLSLLWDFVLGCGAVSASAYIYAAAIMHRRASVLDTHLDADSVHTKLSSASLFADFSDDDIAAVLAAASRLMDSCSFGKLPNGDATFNVWFGEFNRHSVLVCPDVPEGPEQLAEVMKLQETEQQDESRFEAEQFAKALGAMDSMAGSIDSMSSSAPSLFSSLTSLSAASTGINNTLASSSNALKKMLQLNDEPGKRPRMSPRGFYRLSLTIGFFGVLIHCLLQQTELSSFVRLSTREALESWRQFVSPGAVRQLAHSVVASVKEPGKGLAAFGEVGLGSLKRTVYTWGNLG